jgi:pimeloyl-ACP methyl ester carboxylesterase
MAEELMTSNAAPVTFLNGRGERLFGILHEPRGHVRQDVAILLLSPGVKSRVGPHRLYVKMTHRFVQLGFRVLRFDFYGLGDSAGEVDEPLLADLYRAIQLGRYTADTESAMSWMRSRYGTPRFILAGLCGGALTGLLAARDRADVAGLLALGLPVMLDGSAVDKVGQMTTGQLKTVRAKYLRKLRDPGSWVRLLTFRSNLRLLARALSHGTRPDAQASRARAAGTPTGTPTPPSNANPLVPEAFERALSHKCKMLLLFSESDRLYWEFREKFLDNGGGKLLARHGGDIKVDVVATANHVFTFSEWQHELTSKSSEWLIETFGASSGEPAMPRGAAVESEAV